MKNHQHVSGWAIFGILALTLWVPRAIQRQEKATIMRKLGAETCRIREGRAGTSQREAFLEAMKNLRFDKQTSFEKGTESDLWNALHKCGITAKSLGGDYP